MFTMGCASAPIMHSILTCIEFQNTIIFIFVVSSEKPLFLREILNKTYSVSAYFWGKNSSEFPFHVSFPIIQVLIIYYSLGLSRTSEDKIVILSKFTNLISRRRSFFLI